MGKLYIAYGSNLNLQQMKYRCPTAKVVGISEIKDYELLFRGSKNSAVATVEPALGGRVPVLVWDIQPKDERALDRYEGWPHLYRKENVTVELNGKLTDTMVYVMNEGHILGTPSPGYYNTILQGYQSAGFDQQVLDDAVQESAIRFEEQMEEPKLWDMKFWE